MKSWFRWLRVGLLPTAWCNAWVAAALATNVDELEIVGLLVLAVVPSCLYLFGMGLNDYADRKRDAQLYPNRPLPSGEIGVTPARGALTVMVLAPLPVAFWHALPSLYVTLGLIAAILLYDLLAKDHPIAGPASMASVRALLYLLGAVAAATAHDPQLGLVQALSSLNSAVCIGPGITLFCYVALLTHFSREEEASRSRQLRQRLLLLMGSVALCISAQFVLFPPRQGWAATLGVVLLVLWLLHAAQPALRSPARAAATTFRLLKGLFALDLLWALSYDRWIIAGIVAGCGLWVQLGFPQPRFLENLAARH